MTLGAKDDNPWRKPCATKKPRRGRKNCSHEQWPQRDSFAWQTGYGAFSVSESNVDQFREYIARQEEHHKKMMFQEEFIAFLRRHNVEYDPKYVWK